MTLMHRWSMGSICLHCKLKKRKVQRPSRVNLPSLGHKAGRIITVVEYSRDGKSWHEGRLPQCRPVTGTSFFFDLDGVFADFDQGFPRIFGLSHKDMREEAMWALVASRPTFFSELPLMDGAAAFFADYAHLRPFILTACPNACFGDAAAAKREWVQKHLGDAHVLPSWGGRNKPLYMRSPGDVLIDDWEANCIEWRRQGGRAILHRSFDETRKALDAILMEDES